MNSELSPRDLDTAKKLEEVTGQAGSIEDSLRTNERVVARVTDGIYRQPGSAVRELIANAYDADATWVSVKTDAPKFSRITVEDDGIGMTPAAVVHLLHNIGGSAKRTELGKELGLGSPQDSTSSPAGRKLIGKLGIGIFSVSQLTHSFQITTKTAGDTFRTVVLVRLKQFADEPRDGDETEFEAGRYQVWREPTDDVGAHGTTIVLTSIRPQTQATLRSEQLWGAIDNPLSPEGEAKSLSSIPRFHIGRVDSNDQEIVSVKQPDRRLPWDEGDEPDVAFKKMVDSVWEAVEYRTTVKLAEVFDTYLQMIWNLALALPLPYVEQSLMDETVADEWAYFYKLANSDSGSASKIESGDLGETVRSLAGLPTHVESGTDFRVLVDGVQLHRPLKFRNLPLTHHVLKRPMVFVGSVLEDFAGFDREVSAGPLEFDGYLFWTPKVAPTEHQGVLVRIHGASGTLFDSTFFSYQVSELTRLRQITCEIFVHQGLEAALNIDRESFNTSHPHTVLLTRWVHSALRQLATAQKREAGELRTAARADWARGTEDRIAQIVESANSLRTDGEGLVPDFRFLKEPRAGLELPRSTLSLDLGRIINELPPGPQIDPSAASIQKLEAITQILAVYGLLDDLSPKERDNLLGSILGVLEAESRG